MMLPFRLSQLFGILIKIHGMAIVNEEGIRLAFQETEDQPEHFLDANVKSLLISWDNLEEFECDRGLLSHQVRLRVRSIEQLRNLPGIKDHELTLEVQKSDRDTMKAFDEAVAGYRAGRRQDNVEDMLDDVRDFLHGL